VASSRADSQNVRNVQQTLEALKLDPGPADGMFGPRTKAAVKRFQEAEKLSATGTLDAQTRARLTERRREHVVQLQKALNETGHNPGPADGVMGSQTRAAVIRYASAPAPASQSGPSEIIERLKRAYEPSLQQSP
jgi:peptidoglycan hydrolase-like protein with peptidoglycan-binding domain